MARSSSRIVSRCIIVILVCVSYFVWPSAKVLFIAQFDGNRPHAQADSKESEQSRTSLSQFPPPITTNTQAHGTIEAWSSPYQIDCKKLSKSLNDTHPAMDEVYKQTLTDPSFLMNIHHPSKDGVSKIIWENGCWECDHVKTLINALSHYSGSYFLDIGGNIGMWSLTAAAANFQTITIEPLPENYRRFCRSVDKNSFHNRTHLINVAATASPATFRLELPPGNMGGTRVVPVQDDTASKDYEHIVKGVSVDSLNLPTNNPVVLKLDVEGHELMALVGATQFLQNANIVYAMMELRPNLHKDSRWKDIFQVLVSKGLKPYRINYEDETALDVEKLDEWKHFKHPKVKYFDVAWRLSDFDP